MNNKWTYFATHSDIVTTMWCEEEPVDTLLQSAGILRIDSGCKGFTTSVLLPSSCTVMSAVTFTDTKLYQRDCCEELCLKLNISRLCVIVKCKQTESHSDGIKYARIKETGLEGKLQNKNGKTTMQSNTTHIL